MCSDILHLRTFISLVKGKKKVFCKSKHVHNSPIKLPKFKLPMLPLFDAGFVYDLFQCFINHIGSLIIVWIYRSRFIYCYKHCWTEQRCILRLISFTFHLQEKGTLNLPNIHVITYQSQTGPHKDRTTSSCTLSSVSLLTSDPGTLAQSNARQT